MSQMDPVTSGTVPRSSGYVPQHLRAMVGGGGNGPSVGSLPMLPKGGIGSFAVPAPSSLAGGAFAPTGSRQLGILPGGVMPPGGFVPYEQPVQQAPTGPQASVQPTPGMIGPGAGSLLYGGSTSPVSPGTAQSIVTYPGAAAGAATAPAASGGPVRSGRPVSYTGQTAPAQQPSRPVVTTPSASRTTQNTSPQASAGGQPTASAAAPAAQSQQPIYTTQVTGLGSNPLPGYNIGGHVYLTPSQLGNPAGLTINSNGSWELNGTPVRTQVVNGQTVLSVADVAAATGGSTSFANGQVTANIPGLGTQSGGQPPGGSGGQPTGGSPLGNIPGAIQGLINTGTQDQGNVGNGAQSLGNVGLGLPGTVANAQGLAQGLAGTSGQVTGMDLGAQAQLQSPAYLQQLAQMQSTEFGAQQMQQMQQALQNQMQQLAARGIGQGGAPGLAGQQLLQQAMGAQSGEQQNIIAQLLGQAPQNLAASGNLGAQAMAAAGAPFQQQMQLGGLQDQALGQSMGAYGQLAGQNFGLAQGLMNPLTSYYNAQAMLPYLQSYLPQLAGMMGAFGGGGMMPMSGGTLGTYGTYP